MKNRKALKLVGCSLVLAGLLGLSGISSTASAQDAGVSVEVVHVATTATDGSNQDLVAKLAAAKTAYDELKAAKDDEQSPVKFAWAGLIAAIAALLLAGVKRAMKLTGKAKKILPWVAVGLSAIAGIALHFAGGLGVFDSVMMGGAAAFSVVLHELGLIPIKGTPEQS